MYALIDRRKSRGPSVQRDGCAALRADFVCLADTTLSFLLNLDDIMINGGPSIDVARRYRY